MITTSKVGNREYKLFQSCDKYKKMFKIVFGGVKNSLFHFPMFGL